METVARLPDATFDEIAVDLTCYARSAHQAVITGEIIFARGGWAYSEYPGLHATMAELQAAATIAGQLVRFFREAAPYETELRMLVDELFRRAAEEEAA